MRKLLPLILGSLFLGTLFGLSLAPKPLSDSEFDELVVSACKYGAAMQFVNLGLVGIIDASVALEPTRKDCKLLPSEIRKHNHETK